MKAISCLGLIVIIGLYGYNLLREKPAPKAVPVETPVETPSEIPTKKVDNPPVPIENPAPPIRGVLSDGKFVTLNRVKEVHSDGVKAIPRGVLVTKLGEKDGKVIITDSKITILANSEDLTNDLELSNKLIQESVPVLAPVLPAENNLIKPESKPEPVRRDYSRNIAILDDQIKEIEDKIDAIKRKSKGGISASGAIIARYEIDLNNLKSQKNSLLRAQ